MIWGNLMLLLMNVFLRNIWRLSYLIQNFLSWLLEGFMRILGRVMLQFLWKSVIFIHIFNFWISKWLWLFQWFLFESCRSLKLWIFDWLCILERIWNSYWALLLKGLLSFLFYHLRFRLKLNSHFTLSSLI